MKPVEPLAGETTLPMIFMARQPVFDTDLNVFGYEILFRSGEENRFQGEVVHSVAASKVMLDSFLVFGLETVTGGKKAFLNMTQNLLLAGSPHLFPAETMVVELLETIQPTPEVIQACRKLKNDGYLLALDDFIFSDSTKPLTEMADIIKVDFLQTAGEKRREIIEKLRPRRYQYLAEKVETLEDFNQAKEFGYSLFQGYFFSKPVIITSRGLPGNKLNYLRILQEASRPDTDFDRLEKIFRLDISLTYKLLRYINSAAFNLRGEVQSIRQALVLLGLQEVRKWVALVIMGGMISDKSQELLVGSFVGACFCERLAVSTGFESRRNDLFLLGMFSLIDAILDRPMAEILAQLPLAADIREALLGGRGRLADLLRMLRAYEQANWEHVAVLARGLGLEEREVADAYMKSLEQAYRVFRSPA